MRYVEIKVFGPDDDNKLSQTGRTDKNGYFAFIPDSGGQWVVTANDGEGHLARAELAVAAPAPAAATEPGQEPSLGAETPPATGLVNTERLAAAAAKPYKIVMVVSLFLNVALLSTILKRGKSSPKRK
jgi:hypothetical protein